jgi:acetylglutamate kinase
MEPAEVVLRFLESVGRRSEAEFYLGLFRAEPKEAFAAISVDANVARHAWEAVVLDLKFLAALGLMPVVVLGLFEPTDAIEHGSRIRRRLEKSQVAAQMLPVEPGGVVETLAAQITQLARAGTVPILTFGPDTLAITAEDRFARMGALLSALKTRKLIFLHRPGGLRQKGELVQVANLTKDFAALQSAKELSRKERAIVAQSRRLIFELVPHKLLVAITSPFNLFRELFTTKGAGTLLRRGAVLERHDGLTGIDRDRLRALITSAFGRPPIEAFFERPLSRLYIEEGYRGAALLVDTPLGTYLTKFAVDREAQGEGMGRDLWEQLAAEHATVFWRARPQNPIVAWYNVLCDGMVRFPDWNVYWKGLPAERIPAAIDFALAQPVDVPLVPTGE